jgi:hypothetical protein
MANGWLASAMPGWDQPAQYQYQPLSRATRRGGEVAASRRGELDASVAPRWGNQFNKMVPLLSLLLWRVAGSFSKHCACFWSRRCASLCAAWEPIVSVRLIENPTKTSDSSRRVVRPAARSGPSLEPGLWRLASTTKSVRGCRATTPKPTGVIASAKPSAPHRHRRREECGGHSTTIRVVEWAGRRETERVVWAVFVGRMSFP